MRPQILKILTNYLIPGVGTALTIDSYRRQIYSQNKQIETINELNEIRERKLMQIIEDKTNSNFETKNKLTAELDRFANKFKEQQACDNKLNQLQEKLNKGEFESGENIKTITSDIKHQINLKEKFQNEQEEAIKELENIIDKSDLSEYFFALVENYKIFIDQLSLEQLVAIINLFGLFMILSTIIFISMLLFGNYLINKLKLDIRYPKLSKYIKIKESLNKHYLMFYIIMLYIIIIAFIIINLYLLLLKYFI